MDSASELLAAAEAGDPRAQYGLARALDLEGQHDAALRWLERAAKAGDGEAGLLLGVRLFTGRAAPLRPEDGVAALAAAAAQGSAEACGYMAGLAAAGRFTAQSWEAAFDHLRRGAALGDARCRAQLVILSGDPAGQKAIDLDAWLSIPSAADLSRAPRIRTFKDFLTPQVRVWLMDNARDKLTVAPIYDDASGGALKSERRSNTNCVFHPIETDVIQELIRARIGKIAGLSPDCLEPLSVLHYEVGQEFRRHVDFIDPNLPGLAADLAEKGQRVATFLVYLNDDFDGAETEFPILALKWKGAAGDAILFYNVDATGAPDRRTMHAGRTPTRGEKWLLSQFIREKPQPLG